MISNELGIISNRFMCPLDHQTHSFSILAILPIMYISICILLNTKVPNHKYKFHDKYSEQ